MLINQEIQTLKGYLFNELDNLTLGVKKVKTDKNAVKAYEARMEYLEGIVEKLEDMERV